MQPPHIIDPHEVMRGSQIFRQYEQRDAMYKTATYLIGHFWGDYGKMADALGVLLLTWNNAFYRYGNMDFDNLEQLLRERLAELRTYRQRNILTASAEDEPEIIDLFSDFLNSLRITTGKVKGRKSPVAVSKALHLLAPAFFPLWDDKIARAYHCEYLRNPQKKYIDFIRITKGIAEKLQNSIQVGDKTLLKIIDEYNYAKYTKKWI